MVLAIQVAQGLLVAMFGTACAETRTEGQIVTPLRLATDSATGALGEGLLNAYESIQPDVPMSLSRTWRASALSALSTGEADAALLLAPPETDPSLFHTPIGWSLLIIVISPDNLVTDLSLSEVRGVFSGEIADWNAIGGPAASIIVIIQEPGSSSALAFETLLNPLTISPASRVAGDDTMALQLVSTTPGSIGYVTQMGIGPQVRAIWIDGIPPTPEFAREYRYPLAASIEFVAPDQPRGRLRQFLNWVLGPAGQQIVARYATSLSR